jgi:superfamily II DNA or RNA helicase
MINTEEVTTEMQSHGLEPREYQTRIISKTCNHFLTGKKSILIESPTGSGKTAMGLTVLKLLQKHQPNIQYGWVAMRRKLLDQAEKENQKIGVTNIKFISMFDKNPPKIDLLITDEGHHSAARTCAELYVKTESKLTLGLSGTPFRTDRVQLCYEKIINDYGVRFLIEKGYLSQFDQYAIPKWTVQTVAHRFLDDPEKWGKSIIFMPTQEQCYDLQNILLNNGIMADVILGSDSETRREEIFNSFETGESKVIINVYLLSEGFDCPDLKSVWVRDACKLATIQMSGRALRKDPGYENKIAQIIQSEQTPFPYTKIAKPRMQYIYDKKWLSLEPRQNVNNIMHLIRKKVLTKQIVLPQYLTNTTKRITSISIDENGKAIMGHSKPRRNTTRR